MSAPRPLAPAARAAARRARERGVGLPHRGVQPQPARPERPGAAVVGQLGVDVQVRGALVDELQVGQGRRALLGDPGVELGPQRAVHPVVLGAELGPPSLVAGLVTGRVAGERGRQRGVLDLQRLAGHDPYERDARGHQRRKRHHVVLDDHVRADPGDDVGELLVAVVRAVDQLGPDRPDPGVELLDGGLAELGRGPGDELLPELPGVRRVAGFASRVASGVSGRGQVDQVLGEAQRRQPAAPRRLGGEHHPVAAPAQHVADADAVVRRAIGALRHEQDGQRRGGHGELLTRG